MVQEFGYIAFGFLIFFIWRMIFQRLANKFIDFLRLVLFDVLFIWLYFILFWR